MLFTTDCWVFVLQHVTVLSNEVITCIMKALQAVCISAQYFMSETQFKDIPTGND